MICSIRFSASSAVANSCAEWMICRSPSRNRPASARASRIPPLPFWRGTSTPTSFAAHNPPGCSPNAFVEHELLPRVHLEAPPSRRARTPPARRRDELRDVQQPGRCAPSLSALGEMSRPSASIFGGTRTRSSRIVSISAFAAIDFDVSEFGPSIPEQARGRSRRDRTPPPSAREAQCHARTASRPSSPSPRRLPEPPRRRPIAPRDAPGRCTATDPYHHGPNPTARPARSETRIARTARRRDQPHEPTAGVSACARRHNPRRSS
jgi:hypothetical protein